MAICIARSWRTTASNSIRPFVLLLLISPYLPRGVRAQFTDQRLCSGMCLCINSVIDCSRPDRIGGVPGILPPDVTTLNIQHGYFHTPILRAKNLTRLSHLTTLKVIYCGLREIEEQAFVNMKSLKFLDLSYNKLKVIVDYTFYTLSLTKLDIQNNPGIRINPKSFYGLVTEELNLRSNSIRHLDFLSFQDLGIKRLFLFNNSISTIDIRFQTVFDDTSKVFDLTANPLHCGCQLAWLRRLLTSILAYRNVRLTCASPRQYANKFLNEIPLTRLTCPTPTIKFVSLDVHPASAWARLECVAAAKQPLGLSWTYQEGAFVKTVRKSPSINAASEASLSVNVTLTDFPRSYNCTSWVEGNLEQRTVIIHLQRNRVSNDLSVQQQLQSEKLYHNSSRIVAPRELNFTAEEDESYTPLFYRKQFNLLEMIGAVVGSFVGTVGILFLVLWIIRKNCSRNKQVKARPYYYDVPTTAPPPLPSSPPFDTGEIEFFDFKTQERISVNRI